MKLKDIIKYLNLTDSCEIWQIDVNINNYEKPEIIFEGSILNIPWVYLDSYLFNDKNGEYEAISVAKKENGSVYFEITVSEKEPNDIYNS